MRLEVVDSLSVASGAENEDRVGAAKSLAWVIDGATDVLPEALTTGYSDAAWFAARMNTLLHEIAEGAAPALAALPALVAERLAPAFHTAARRTPESRAEHPSAAGLVVRADADGGIDYVSLGDCILIAETGDGLARIGVDEMLAGDAWVVSALTATVSHHTTTDARDNTAPLTRADLWPRLRAIRARMNTPEGYGIFSITAPPQSMIVKGRLRARRGSRILLASDGLTRLVDVFRRYAAALFAAAWERGLASLVQELRALEQNDSACTRYPRAKISDDTSGLLLRLTP